MSEKREKAQLLSFIVDTFDDLFLSLSQRLSPRFSRFLSLEMWFFGRKFQPNEKRVSAEKKNDIKVRRDKSEFASETFELRKFGDKKRRISLTEQLKISLKM